MKPVHCVKIADAHVEGVRGGMGADAPPAESIPELVATSHEWRLELLVCAQSPHGQSEAWGPA